MKKCLEDQLSSLKDIQKDLYEEYDRHDNRGDSSPAEIWRRIDQKMFPKIVNGKELKSHEEFFKKKEEIERLIKRKIEKAMLPRKKKESLPWKLPEIEVKKELGPILLSLTLKIDDKKWGVETKNTKLKILNNFFDQSPKFKKDTLAELHELQKNGFDEEALYNLSLIYSHPERQEEIAKFLKKRKPNAKIKGSFTKMNNLLKKVETRIRANVPIVIQELKEIREKDSQEKIKRLPGLQKKYEKIRDFFSPQRNTTKIEKIILLPTDPLIKSQSGRAYILGKTLFLQTESKNEINEEREFLRSIIINPIVEKLDKKLSPEQKEKISSMASAEREKEGQRENYFSLLCEELINTYTINISRDTSSAYEEAKKNTPLFSEDICEKNELSRKLCNFYKKYEEEKKKSPRLTFEKFFLQNFAKEIEEKDL